MINLLDETELILSQNNKTVDDITFVQCDDYMIPKDNFLKIAKDALYDNGFGGVEVGIDLTVHGVDFILVRENYDGAEEWRYHRTSPVDSVNSVEALTRCQAKRRDVAIENDVDFGECKIASLNRNDYYEGEFVYD